MLRVCKAVRSPGSSVCTGRALPAGPVYIRVHVYIYIYTLYTYIYIHVCVCINIHMYTNIHMLLSMHFERNVCMLFVYTYMCMYTYIHMYVHIHTCINTKRALKTGQPLIDRHRTLEVVARTPNRLSILMSTSLPATWTPKVRKTMACWAVLRGFGLLILHTFEVLVPFISEASALTC